MSDANKPTEPRSMSVDEAMEAIWEMSIRTAYHREPDLRAILEAVRRGAPGQTCPACGILNSISECFDCQEKLP